jgi:hypothetical protein
MEGRYFIEDTETGEVYSQTLDDFAKEALINGGISILFSGAGYIAGRMSPGSRQTPADSTKSGGTIPLVNGRKPINSKYAGQTHPSGVRFKENGFPDFTPYAKAQVNIKGLTGNYARDAAMANKAVGLKRTPNGYVWHHVENAKTMQLIPKEIHNAARHTGGAAIIRSQKAED